MYVSNNDGRLHMSEMSVGGNIKFYGRSLEEAVQDYIERSTPDKWAAKITDYKIFQ